MSFIGCADTKEVEKRRHQVVGLRQTRQPGAGQFRHTRIVNHQRNMRNFLIVGLQVLAPPVVLGQQKPVICGQDQRGIRPEVVGIEII